MKSKSRKGRGTAGTDGKATHSVPHNCRGRAWGQRANQNCCLPLHREPQGTRLAAGSGIAWLT